jgi:hypothetical protein
MRTGRWRGSLPPAGFTAGAIALTALSFAVMANAGVSKSSAKPVNTSPPTISGTAQEGQTLTAARGAWSNDPTDFDYVWRRCATDGFSCANIVGATGLTYSLKAVDVGNTLRFRVVAKNADGRTSAVSAATSVIQNAPPTTTTTPPPPPPPAINRRPAMRILGVRFVGVRVYVRMRVCDDSRRHLRITERDSKRGVPAYVRRFRTLAVPRPCSTLRRTWMPAPRFRHRLTITLWARDFAGLRSRPAARTITR